MMKVLAFDTSSKALAVAILDGDLLVAETTVNIKKNHSTTLMPAIDFLIRSVDWSPEDLERIVVAEGPGSYTGLRVAVATAKTLAYALDVDLVGVSSLYALGASVPTTGLVVPILDARRNNVYAGFYDNGRAVKPDAHMAFADVLDSLKEVDKVTFVGEVGAFAEQIRIALPTATVVASLPSAYAIGKYGQTLQPVDVNAFAPQYLKRVEAEENWLKTHQEGDVSQYIKRV